MESSYKLLVTAVITTYKREPNIVRRALESVLKQSYENIEVYVVNDCPTDKNLVESLRLMIDECVGSRTVYYIVVDKNGGACKAKNLALFKAKGKYFACLDDDDDEWLPEKISVQVERMEANPDAAIAYCNAILKYKKEKREIRFSEPQSEGYIYSEIVAKNNIGSCSFPMFRADVIKNFGGFDERMPALQDWELYLRVLKDYKAVYIHEPMAVYYFHSGERISTHYENRANAYELIHDKIRTYLPVDRKSAASFYLMRTYFYSLAGNMKRAFVYYRQGIIYDPLNLKRNLKDFIRMIGRILVKPKKV